ncbi:hypothetical protein DFQ28_005187 [Apophysomyces sp. BC1034]|nr:hypothetical protein DFQ29_004563 [Apophysomyces sp. BC1021]KAG0188255.1 hypothetical protein DFQ28_005187 [Apophysomyces sp. BC1034]
MVIGIIGTQWALNETPFWIPTVFIPIIGLLLGVAISGMAVALRSCLTEVGSHTDQIETYLSFGASRWEACRSIAIEAVRLAMLPSINQMSIIGLITIPGAMTGQILGGAPIMEAVRYQQIVTFIITASTGLAVLGVVVHAALIGSRALQKLGRCLCVKMRAKEEEYTQEDKIKA